MISGKFQPNFPLCNDAYLKDHEPDEFLRAWERVEQMYNVHDDPPGFLASERLRFFGECLTGNVLWTWDTILDGFRLQDPPQPEPGNEAQAEEIWNYCVRM